MKSIIRYAFGMLAAAGMMTSCSDFEPYGYEQAPEAPTAQNVKTDISGHTVNVTWQLPASSMTITDVQMIVNANTANPVSLGAGATTYSVKGLPLGEENLFTVKVCYDNKYISEGVSTTAVLPEETFAGVTNLTKSVAGRTVTLSWTAPTQSGVTAIRVYRDGDVAAAQYLEPTATGIELKAQPMDTDLNYTVEAIYDEYYASTPANVVAFIPYIQPKMAYLLLAKTINGLPDDDEKAAAKWFAAQDNAEMVSIEEVATLNADEFPVLWVEIDRVGQEYGWQNLPVVGTEEGIAALKAYTVNGGNLYLSNMATQLTVPLGFVPEDMAPGIFGNGEGGVGDDVWVLNPHLGWDFRDGGSQGYYDRAEHAIYKGITLEDPNNYGYSTVPLIGPGQREDHNCMWDCNAFGAAYERLGVTGYPDVITRFEAATSSMVLATWGHVRDHCVAGIVEFYANANHGRCIANGLAAYEWNQNSGTNPYQENVEKLTENILKYLQ